MYNKRKNYIICSEKKNRKLEVKIEKKTKEPVGEQCSKRK